MLWVLLTLCTLLIGGLLIYLASWIIMPQGAAPVAAAAGPEPDASPPPTEASPPPTEAADSPAATAAPAPDSMEATTDTAAEEPRS